MRILVAAQALIDTEPPIVVALPIVEQEDPQSLLAVRIGDLGWAVATLIERTLVSRFTERVGTASTEELSAVDVALRASLDL